MTLSLWVELLVRSGALLLTGEIIRRMSHAQSAAFRHKLLLWVFALLALLPVMSALFPELPVRLPMPGHESRGVVTVIESTSRVATGGTGHSVNWPFWVWISGVMISCVPLLVGAVSVWRIGRRAIRHSLVAETEILISEEVQVPITYGVIRRRVLLPIQANDWSGSRLQAVLLHELAHVRRRDVAAQACVHLIAAMWWFQPLVWMLRRKLRVESEFACDAAAIRSGVRPSDYASELLGLARSVGNWNLPRSAIAMMRSSSLEDRVRAVLDCPNALLRPRLSYAMASVLSIAAIAASAVTLHPKQSLSESGGSTMKRTILSALLTSAGLSAATVSGVVHDSNGAPVAEAKVMIYNPDTAATKQEKATDADGKFSFSGSGTGQYILQIEKAGLSSIFREFDLKADSEMDREFTMSPEGMPLVADKPITSTAATGKDGQLRKVSIGGGVAQSNLLTKTTPVYPVAAKKAGTQGTVEIEATISKDGIPTELRVVSSPSDELSSNALEAVRQWRYRPTLLNGNPVMVVTTVIVNYTLLQ